MSYPAQARAEHRQKRVGIIETVDHAELEGQEYILYHAVRKAVRNAAIYRLERNRIAAVLQRTLNDQLFKAKVTL